MQEQNHKTGQAPIDLVSAACPAFCSGAKLMIDSAIWEVVLSVEGPVTVRGRVQTTQPESFRDLFESEIDIKGVSSGIQVTMTERAPNHTVAYRGAVFFFGRMLDALTVTINRPMYLSLTER